MCSKAIRMAWSGKGREETVRPEVVRITGGVAAATEVLVLALVALLGLVALGPVLPVLVVV